MATAARRRLRAQPSAASVRGSGTASHSVHQSFGVQVEARERRLVALEIDRVRQLTKHLADELVRVSSAMQDALDILV
jgi:hypothetical protein